MLHRDFRGLRKQLDGQVRTRPIAGRAVEQRRSARAAEVDEIGHGADRMTGIRRDEIRILREHGDRGEIIDGPIGKRLEGRRRKGVSGGNCEERVAVGRRASDLRRRRGAGGAGPALHHQPLPEPTAQAVGNQPRHEIGWAARCSRSRRCHRRFRACGCSRRCASGFGGPAGESC